MRGEAFDCSMERRSVYNRHASPLRPLFVWSIPGCPQVSAARLHVWALILRDQRSRWSSRSFDLSEPTVGGPSSMTNQSMVVINEKLQE